MVAKSMGEEIDSSLQQANSATIRAKPVRKGDLQIEVAATVLESMVTRIDPLARMIARTVEPEDADEGTNPGP